MEPPAGYAFRAPIPDDLEFIGDVLIADQRADGVEPVLDAHFIRQVWSRSGFDLTDDAWMATDTEGTVVAYGQVRREEPDVVGSWGVVAPSHRGHGVGSMLFDRIDARASELLTGVPSPHFRHSINTKDAAAAEMARARGLRPIRHFWHMQIDLTGPIEPAPEPAGIQMGGVDPLQELRAVHAVLYEAFVDDWGDYPPPFDRWAEEEAASPSYDPTLWLLARVEGVPVGVLIASAGDDGGWVDWLAVLNAHRARGIARALLRRSFASLSARGLRRVMVNVDAENPTGATTVYERVGMHVANRWDLWERSSDGLP